VTKVINKSQVLVTSLIKAKKDLENLLFIVISWKKNGIDGKGVIPFALIQLEEKLKKSIEDIDEMIKVANKA